MSGAAKAQDVDLELMRRVAENDPESVAQLYDRFASLVYRLAFQAMPTRADAEDAVQEIFVRLWRTADRYDPKRAALVTWVMLISRRHLVDRLRRTKARVKAMSLDDRQSTSEGNEQQLQPAAGLSLEEAERFGELMRRVNKLPDLQKTVVTRAYLGGQTLRQIGDDFNTPIGTIKSALSRALVRLRERGPNEELAS
jgi:RNA polymerase sigma-70 factor (ECF subfamily)